MTYLDNKKYMAQETILYEPESALFAKENGLINYQKIISGLNNFLKTPYQCLYEGYKIIQLIISEGIKTVNSLGLVCKATVKPTKPKEVINAHISTKVTSFKTSLKLFFIFLI